MPRTPLTSFGLPCPTNSEPRNLKVLVMMNQTCSTPILSASPIPTGAVEA